MKIILLLLGIAIANTTAENQFRPIHITGTWVSNRPEKTASGKFAVREFNFGKTAWEVRSTVYNDSLLAIPVFMFRATGKYHITAASDQLPDTQNAIFYFDHKYVTAKTTDTTLITESGLLVCGLTYAQEKDITESGCSYLASLKDCGQEYDLVSIKNNRLYLGLRPASGGMCSEDKRPAKLGPPLKRKH